MEEFPGSNVEFMVGGKEGGNEQVVAAVNSGDVWNVQLIIGVGIPSMFQNNLYTPLDDYIDKDNPLYTKDLIEDATTYLGKTYAVGNVMMSDFQYGIYNETLYNDYNIKTPAQYYSEGAWNRESFLKMIDDLKANQVQMYLNFEKPNKTGTYAVEHHDDGTIELAYNKQANREWLTFIKNIVYDKGITGIKNGKTYTREVGFALDILPHILIDAKNSSTQDTIRYIPFLAKENPISSYIVEYYFGVPNGAKDIEASVKLIDYMIEACVEDRTEMYKENMVEEDYKIFEESALNSHYIVRDCGVWPENEVVEYFRAGGAVSTNIDENVTRMQTIVDDYNKQVEEDKAKMDESAQTPESTAK
jgi:maltose-binding protein MalE